MSVIVAACVLGPHWIRADDEPGAEGPTKANTAAAPLKPPDEWPEGHPLPKVASNCAACHLTAGQQLTAAVVHFAGSAHDAAEMTCSDCHGGNLRDDVRAHEEEFGFIGTKLSAHIQNCTDCHNEEAKRLSRGPHHWDFATRINLEYPTCIDCHGNHDVGSPPEDFKLIYMCKDCHESLEKDYPQLTSIVRHHDLLVGDVRKLRQTKNAADNDMLKSMRDAMAALRSDTMQVIHKSKEVDADTAARLTARVRKLRSLLKVSGRRPDNGG